MNLKSIAAAVSAVAAASAFAAAPAPKAGAVTAELDGAYEDPAQANIPFGQRSYYLTPWRAYMDTWPASRWMEMPGVTFGGHPATAKILAEAGFHAARVEWSWSGMEWDNDHFAKEDEMRATMRGLREAGIRPIILLNANHGLPGPTRTWTVKLREDATKGQRFLIVDDTSRMRLGYCGLTCLNGEYRASFPTIVATNAEGRCELSAPLPCDLKAGDVTISETRFKPFSGAVFADGTPNPASDETMQGWHDYVGVVCRVAKEGLGTTNATDDVGFDLEVWNEYTFGSCFLDINHYYDPHLEFKEPITYHGADGRVATGSEAILPMTVDYVNDPANHCPGVNVFSGFSNQRPWDNLTERWPGQTGISRHYYTGTELMLIDPEHPDVPNSGPLDKFGKACGEPDGKDWHTVIPGTFFIPEMVWSMPEYWSYGQKTEMIVRDVQPFPSPFDRGQHFRYGHNGDGRPGQVWRTEVNYWRWPWAERLMKETGCKADDPRLTALMHEMGAHWLLRQLVLSGHKGETTHTVFQANTPDDVSLGVIPASYFELLEKSDGTLTDELRDAIGPQVKAVGRVTALFRDGRPFDVARKLRVDRLVEHDPRLVWRGDGSERTPDRWNRDDFAILPFQIDEHTFQVAYYVITHNAVQVWDESADAFDPARYTMPPQTFDITLGNIRGKRAKVTAYDPVTDKEVPVAILGGDATTLTVRVESVDYPRFFRVTERDDGPMLSDVAFSRDADGTPVVSFTANMKGVVDVSFAAYPARAASGENAPAPQSIKVKRGRKTSVRLEGASIETDAVLLRFRANELEMRWPQWDYDLRGVLKFALPEHAAKDGAATDGTGAATVSPDPSATIKDLPLSDPSQAVHD